MQFNEKKRRPSGAFPTLPAGMDGVLKAFYGNPKRLAETGLKVQGFPKPELLKDWQNNWKCLRLTNKKGHTLKGTVDNLVMENGKVVVLDYKTRGFPLKDDTVERYRLQMSVYTYILEQLGYKTSKHTYLLFYYPRGLSKYDQVSFHVVAIKLDVEAAYARSVFEQAIGCLEGTKPPNCCEWCAYG